MRRLPIWALGFLVLSGMPALAQDVPGIEICTVDKTMERRTSCLQSNVDFLVKTISRMRSDQEQKLGAANARIDMLNNAVVALQKTVAELQAAKKDAPAQPAAATPKPAPDAKEAPTPKASP